MRDKLNRLYVYVYTHAPNNISINLLKVQIVVKHKWKYDHMKLNEQHTEN